MKICAQMDLDSLKFTGAINMEAAMIKAISKVVFRTLSTKNNKRKVMMLIATTIM